MKVIDKKNPAVFLVCLAGIALILTGSFLFISDMKLNVDETFHYPKIKSLLEYNFNYKSRFSTLPGYHYAVFFLAWILGTNSVFSIRLISFFISMLSMVAFYVLAMYLNKSDSNKKVLQYVFFPLLYPFLFMIYTDVTSLLLVTVSIYLTLRRKYHIAGFLGIISCLVRQNNIIWVGFLFLLMLYFLFHDKDISVAKSSDKGDNIHKSFLKNAVLNGAFYLLGFFLFMVFVLINKGVAVGDVEMHPPFKFYFENIYFMLFSFFFLFLPMNISNILKIIDLVKNHKLVPLYIVGFFLFFMVTFKIDHPYNTEQWAQWFLRNQILTFFLQNPLLKALFFLPILFSVLSLLTTRLYEKIYYLIYPLSILFLAPHWLVDPRYYLLPFSLFILFKEEGSYAVTSITIIMYVSLSCYFFLNIVSYNFFF